MSNVSSTALPAGSSEIIRGIAASSGIAFGDAIICHCDETLIVPRRAIEDVDLAHEMERFEVAARETEIQLLGLAEEIRQASGSAEAAIFEAQVEMLHDPMFRSEIFNRCRRGKINIEAAVSDAAGKLVAAFAAVDDPVCRERAADLQDVSRRLLNRLLQREETEVRDLPAGCVVVARELLPSLAAGLGRKKIRALIAERGGTTAHAVILARSLGIPTIIHAEGATERIKLRDPLIVDGIAGHVFIRPTDEVRREYERIETDLAARQAALQELIALPAVTRDGATITLGANVGQVADASSAAACRADEIGLYRTEFAFLVHPEFPTEDQQYRLYRAAAEQVSPRNMTLRVLDVGSDKLLPYFPLPAEANPSLGRRGTRLLLDHPEILRTQLRAILRLSATHSVSILFPMIGGLDEFRAAKRTVESAQAELRNEHQEFAAHIRIGAMIETPSAAVTARRIAREADFLSIGTNDLVQYLLTTDRTAMEMAEYYEPMHPAVIQTLKLVINAGAAEGKPVSICGEIAGNPSYTALLIGLGVRSLSLAPSELLEIKRVVRSLDTAEAGRLADRALAAGTIGELKACVAGTTSLDFDARFARRALQRWRNEGGAGP
jgi:phosphotransferase system enzyme I (PtsI)